MSLIVVDVEIQKAILGKGEEPIEGIEYCGGWDDKAGMGVAVACTYELPTGLSRVFYKDDLPELAEYIKGKWTGGFNTLGFDLPLLKHHGIEYDKHVDIMKHVDVLAMVWDVLGRRYTGWKLDDICAGTFQLQKSGDGALAPVWWQQGKVGRVSDYCLRDVWLEAKLIRHVVDHRHVVNRFGDRVDFIVPQDVIDAVTRD